MIPHELRQIADLVFTWSMAAAMLAAAVFLLAVSYRVVFGETRSDD